MSTRREKNKPKNTLNKQLEQPEAKPKKARGDTTIESGKYLLRLSELVFAGVILAVIVQTGELTNDLVVWGLLVMVIFYVFGILLIKIGYNKKSRV